MPALTIDYRDDAERLALEQAIAYVAQLRQLAQDAPDGAVLAACEKLALRDGRALLRSTLAAALDGRIATAEQKGGPRASVPRRTPDAPRASTNAPSLPPSAPSASAVLISPAPTVVKATSGPTASWASTAT